MYEAFFGLQRKAFGLTSDPSLLFLNEKSREALAGITYAILHRKGLMVLTGDAGTGKSTLLARVLRYLPAKVHVCNVINPTLTVPEFLEMILLNFGIGSIPESKTLRIGKLFQLLRRNQDEDRISVLVVDEAHKLPAEVLEEIRLLGNFENPEQKLLQIVLAGQPELSDVLNRDEMRQLKQRIAVRLRIEPLSEEEVKPYMQCRWKEAGGTEPLPFTPEALSVLAMCASGIPRLINSLSDNSLMWAFAEESNYVLAQHVRNAASDLDLALPAALPTPPQMPILLPHASWPSPAVERQVPPVAAIAPLRDPPSKSVNGSDRSGSKPWWNRWTVRLGITV